MKMSKRCPLCHLSPSFHRELLRKRMMLGSVAKAYAWFQRERPTPEITEYKFQSHFKRHVTEEDYEEVKISPKNPLVKSEDLAPVIFEKKGVAVNPHVEIASLYLATISQLKDLAKLASDDLEASSLLLKYIGECRKQIQLIHSMKPSKPPAGMDSSKNGSSFNEANDESLYAMFIDIDNSEGDAERSASQSRQKD